MKLRPYENAYNAMRKASIGNGRERGMSYFQYLQFTKEKMCHYCRANIPWSETGGAYRLDRKDNEEGYTPENCVVCCPSCNWGKGDVFTYDEWVFMTQALVELRTQRQDPKIISEAFKSVMTRHFKELKSRALRKAHYAGL